MTNYTYFCFSNIYLHLVFTGLISNNMQSSARRPNNYCVNTHMDKIKHVRKFGCE